MTSFCLGYAWYVGLSDIHLIVRMFQFQAGFAVIHF